LETDFALIFDENKPHWKFNNKRAGLILKRNKLPVLDNIVKIVDQSKYINLTAKYNEAYGDKIRNFVDNQTMDKMLSES